MTTVNSEFFKIVKSHHSKLYFYISATTATDNGGDERVVGGPFLKEDLLELSNVIMSTLTKENDNAKP